MIDRFDESAILIGGRRNERLVGSLRILCREPEEEWEHDRFWSWRDEFPPRRSTVDVSRLCLEWDERRIQSVVCLLRAVGYVMLELRRRSRRRQIQGAPRSARAESRGVPALRD